MNFLDAVNAMKKGKKVHRGLTWYAFYDNCDGYDNKFVIKNKHNQTLTGVQTFNINDFMGDWEVVKEKPWCLADKSSIYEGEGEGRTYGHDNVKKMLDIIKKRLSDSDVFYLKAHKIIDEVSGLY